MRNINVLGKLRNIGGGCWARISIFNRFHFFIDEFLANVIKELNRKTLLMKKLLTKSRLTEKAIQEEHRC